MIRLLCGECCWPTLYWGEDAVAVDISEKLSAVAMHDPQNAKKINNCVLQNLHYFDHDYPYSAGSSNWKAPNLEALDKRNDYQWTWRSPNQDLVTAIATATKKHLNYDAYQKLNTDQQNKLAQEIALRLWTPLKLHAKIEIYRGWRNYDIEIATLIPSIEVVWQSVDQDTVDKAFLSLTNSSTACQYINEPLSGQINL
jgi:hypothetical protein